MKEVYIVLSRVVVIFHVHGCYIIDIYWVLKLTKTLQLHTNKQTKNKKQTNTIRVPVWVSLQVLVCIYSYLLVSASF